MKQKNLKKAILIILSIIGFIIMIPIILFIINFMNTDVSSEISNWGAFGSFFGGVLGSIISFFSLIILGYITYIVGKNSNEENKNLFLFKKRIEAYDELMKYIPKLLLINSLSATKLNFKQKFNEILMQEESPEDIFDKYMEIMKSVEFYSEFYYYLSNYRHRFAHLFNYNFNSKDYKNILVYSEKFMDRYSNHLNNFNPTEEKTENASTILDIDSFKKMIKYLNKFVNDLKTELE